MSSSDDKLTSRWDVDTARRLYRANSRCSGVLCDDEDWMNVVVAIDDYATALEAREGDARVYRDERDELRERFRLLTDAQGGNGWRVLGDGRDDPESMSDGMTVVMSGRQYREMVGIGK